jgi:hypothetical protein
MMERRRLDSRGFIYLSRGGLSSEKTIDFFVMLAVVQQSRWCPHMVAAYLGGSGDRFSKVPDQSLEMAHSEVIPRSRRRTPMSLGSDIKE